MENITKMKGSCPICETEIDLIDAQPMMFRCKCPVCGSFSIYKSEIEDESYSYDINHMASFLFYNSQNFHSAEAKYYYYTQLDGKDCERYRMEFSNGNNICGFPIHVDQDIVESWYPKSFNEKVNMIIIFFGKKTNHLGEELSFCKRYTIFHS